ncbi:hypothetical protein OXPF_29200 [Oxobacter pfennigii]|uniref:DUF5320 domain-containing protein n=1 Tax=Oxobacter pfennigii TaxID=36849 RepID=A0A0P9AE17_9CLOT|nr:hypothetical protein OXPF_29200 [Oxobacter pfennigii]
MPKRDGTGPRGAGSMTGRGLGPCIGANIVRYRADSGVELGLACRYGFAGGSGRGFAVNQPSFKIQKEKLKHQKNILQNRLEAIDKQLENL